MTSLVALCLGFTASSRTSPSSIVSCTPPALRRTRSPVAARGKGMDKVALVELGSGCCHYNNSTKAAIRACNNAIEWNSVKVRTIIPGSYDAMRLHVHIGVPAPETLDLEAIQGCFPYGSVVDFLVEEGGLLGSTRESLPAEEPTEALMTVACACVTVGWNENVDEKGGDEATAIAAAPPPSPALNPSPPPPPQHASPNPTVSLRSAGLGIEPTQNEMTPGSAEMLARANLSARKWVERVVTPLEAFALLADEEEIEIYDVRTHAQRVGHDINGKAALTVTGAMSVPLDDMVSGSAPLPPTDIPVILVCSRGPKSLVALDYLAEACPKVVCIEGGITAWDSVKLPTATAE